MILYPKAREFLLSSNLFHWYFNIFILVYFPNPFFFVVVLGFCFQSCSVVQQNSVSAILQASDSQNYITVKDNKPRTNQLPTTSAASSNASSFTLFTPWLPQQCITILDDQPIIPAPTTPTIAIPPFYHIIHTDFYGSEQHCSMYLATSTTIFKPPFNFKNIRG